MKLKGVSLMCGTGSVPAGAGYMEGNVQGLCWRTKHPTGSGNTEPEYKAWPLLLVELWVRHSQDFFRL